MPQSCTVWSAALRQALLALTFALALGLLVRPVCAQPGEASVFVARAIVAYQDKQYDEALAALQEALRLDPNNVDALYYSGLVYIQTARPDQAAVALEAAH